MESIIKRTRIQFVATILIVVVIIVGLSWAILQTFNVQTIGTPAEISDIHNTATNNQEFSEYYEQQKEYEAHFVTLASSIKQQEQDRLTAALAITSIIALLIGVIVAMIAAKKLTKPVIEAYESQERFVQDAAHELRNPLAALTVALQQTKQTGPLITIFRRQTKRLIHINEDLLFLERRAKQEPRPTNISELLEDVMEELRPLANKKTIVINQEIEENIIKTISPNDYVRLVKNILDNAIKYSPVKSRVSISQKRHKHSIVIVVTDKGIGIPLKDQSTIGDRFFRASNTGNIDGTGLGLAIVHKILNNYGGSIDFVSAENKGTTVTITMPA
jgi:signal transduction histidine kinase